jgi:hypothetical protein
MISRSSLISTPTSEAVEDGAEADTSCHVKTVWHVKTVFLQKHIMQNPAVLSIQETLSILLLSMDVNLRSIGADTRLVSVVLFERYSALLRPGWWDRFRNVVCQGACSTALCAPSHRSLEQCELYGNVSETQLRLELCDLRAQR